MGWLRNLIYLLLLVLALPWLLWRRFRTGRYRHGVRQKLLGLEHAPARELGQPLVWLHGVSVGEIQLLKPLVESWRNRCPQLQFAVSTTTDSGMELARKLFPKDTLLFYFPLDFTWAVRRTLNCLQPALLVLVELELWPNLIEQSVYRRLPIAVVNGRLSLHSFARYQRLSLFTKRMFHGLSLVAAQSESNAERFRQCGAAATTMVSGSIKFDNVSFDREAVEVELLRQLIGLTSEHRVWVMGSTQAHEEMAAVQAWQQLHRDFPQLKLIVVPRHPSRFDAVADEIARIDIRLLRRSKLKEPVSASAWDVLLVDSVGELKWWWGLAEIAIVGGSFGARGGQNMLEPAAYGANVAFGPNTSNFRDIVDLLLTGQAAVRLQSLDEIEAWVRQELTNPSAGQVRGQRAREIIASGQGALQRTIDALNALL